MNSRVLNKPLIILGSPRSGTTILGELLSRHPQLHYEEEPRLTWRYGNDGKSDMLSPGDLDARKIECIRSAFSRRLVASGKHRLLEKTPSNALRPEFVEAIFPDAKFIYISRDPVECILSIRDLWTRKAHGLKDIDRSNYLRRLKEMRPGQIPYYSVELIKRCLPAGLRGGQTVNLWGPRFPGMKSMLAEIGLLPVCCLQWRFCVEACQHYIRQRPGHVLQIELEKLDGGRLAEVFAHCELEPAEPVIEAFEKNFVSKMAAGRRENAAPEDLLTIQRWIGPQYS